MPLPYMGQWAPSNLSHSSSSSSSSSNRSKIRSLATNKRAGMRIVRPHNTHTHSSSSSSSAALVQRSFIVRPVSCALNVANANTVANTIINAKDNTKDNKCVDDNMTLEGWERYIQLTKQLQNNTSATTQATQATQATQDNNKNQGESNPVPTQTHTP